MKILLQHNRTLQYLRANSTWTKQESDALIFQHSQAAIDFAYENNLLDVYVTVKFLGGEADVVAPLPDRAPSVLLLR